VRKYKRLWTVRKTFGDASGSLHVGPTPLNAPLSLRIPTWSRGTCTEVQETLDRLYLGPNPHARCPLPV